MIKTTNKYTIFILLTMLLIAIFASLLLGFVHTTAKDLISALFSFDGSQEHIIIMHSRIPRTINALLTGGALGISGLMLQALTKNNLASSSVLGINSGASLAVVVAMFIFPQVPWSVLYGASFIGAFFSGVFVYAISGGLNGKVNSKDLVLSGMAISGLFFSLTQAFLYGNNAALEDVLYWMTGAVDGKPLDIILTIMPFVVVGVIISVALHKSFTTFELGDEMASSLGMNVVKFKILIVLLVSVLSGASVALSGPIAFVCLVTPHIARYLFGGNYRILMPTSVILGSVMLLLSDVLSRFILFPKELPVGAVTALLGGIFFIYLFMKREKTND